MTLLLVSFYLCVSVAGPLDCICCLAARALSYLDGTEWLLIALASPFLLLAWQIWLSVSGLRKTRWLWMQMSRRWFNNQLILTEIGKIRMRKIEQKDRLRCLKTNWSPNIYWSRDAQVVKQLIYGHVLRVCVCVHVCVCIHV